MMKVVIKNQTALKTFVKTCESFEEDVKAVGSINKYELNAKSLLGILSIMSGEPFELSISTDDTTRATEFAEAIKSVAGVEVTE